MRSNVVEMILADIENDRMETRRKIFELIEQAIAQNDWDTVRKYGRYSADVAASLLMAYGNRLSEDYKCQIALYHYDDKGDAYPIIRRYVRKSIKYRPENWRDELPEAVRSLDTFTVYRAGVEPIEKAPYSMSWTLSRDVAEWFAERQEHYGWGTSHLYKGVMSADKVIAYLNGRDEFEIVQYRNVRQIEEITRRKPSEEYLAIRAIKTNFSSELATEKDKLYEEYINRTIALEKVS